MIVLAFASALASASSVPPPVMEQCRAALARRIDGDLGEMSVDSLVRRGSTRTLRGSMVALIGMGDPGPGRAKAHHLIRATYDFKCSTRGGRVRKLSLNRTE